MLIGLIIIVIILIAVSVILNENPSKETEDKKIDYSNYETNNYVMTQTELKFYRELKKVTDELELIIFPQINLERIINVKDNNKVDRNRIKSRSIDFTIVNNKNCKIVCCIELDDYTHNRENVKKLDNFKNELFKQVNIPLYRVKVSNIYNLEEIREKFKKLKSYVFGSIRVSVSNKKGIIYEKIKKLYFLINFYGCYRIYYF